MIQETIRGMIRETIHLNEVLVQNNEVVAVAVAVAVAEVVVAEVVVRLAIVVVESKITH